MILNIPRRWLVFALTTLLFVMSQFYRVSMTVITPQLTADLSLSHQQLGTCSAMFFYPFALAQIPLIIYLDRIGARLSMTVLTLIGIGGAIVFAMAQSFSVLLLGRILLGIGMACNLVGSLKLISQWFSPNKFATLTALIASFGTTGNLLAATPLVYLVQMIGWRFAYGFFALFNLLLVCLFFTVVKDKPDKNPSNEEVKKDIKELASPLFGIKQLFSMKDYWMISLGAFCRYGIFAAVQALWAGPFLIEVMKYSNVVTGNLLLLLNIGLIIGGPFLGVMSDSILKSRKIVIVTGLMGIA
ncbi:MAG: MFS transporter, partial [Desulfobacteraceae bacterium]